MPAKKSIPSKATKNPPRSKTKEVERIEITREGVYFKGFTDPYTLLGFVEALGTTESIQQAAVLKLNELGVEVPGVKVVQGPQPQTARGVQQPPRAGRGA